MIMESQMENEIKTVFIWRFCGTLGLTCLCNLKDDNVDIVDL